MPTPVHSFTAPKTQFLAFEGGHLAYDDTGGTGQLIVALPGMGDLRSSYRFMRAPLVEAGYRFVSVDVRGFGETSAQWDDYSANAVGRDVLALINHLGAGPAIVMGNSFAAGSALWAAHDRPDSVPGVVLLGPIVRDIPVSWVARVALKVGFWGPWKVWFWTTYWNSLFPSLPPADQMQVKAALRDNLRDPERMAALKEMIALSKASTSALLASVRVPALIVMGSRDADFADAPAEAAWLAERLNAQSVVIDGAGHYPHAEMPQQVVGPLLYFLADICIPSQVAS